MTRWSKRRARKFPKIGETEDGNPIWGEPEPLPMAEEEEEDESDDE